MRCNEEGVDGRSVKLVVKRELYERIMVLKAMFGSEQRSLSGFVVSV